MNHTGFDVATANKGSLLSQIRGFTPIWGVPVSEAKAVCWAAKYEMSMEPLRLLLDSGCSTSSALTENDEKKSAVIIAATAKNWDHVRLLLDRGKILETCLLHMAAAAEEPEMINFLLERPSSLSSSATFRVDNIVHTRFLPWPLKLNYTSFIADGVTALHCAAWSGSYSAISTLLRHHAQINKRTKKKKLTALHLVFTNYKTFTRPKGTPDHPISIAKILLEHGAEINAEDLCKITPLYFTAETEDVDAVKFLRDQGGVIIPHYALKRAREFPLVLESLGLSSR
ncbi:ankyrin [Stipitochalara longipes BDJ]|nr:ankyrin [Stipitochalara longipes BDJ]